MSEMSKQCQDELARCQERTRKLAMEKSYLQLVNNLMLRLGEVNGVEAVIDNLLRMLLENLGGSNVSLYYDLGPDRCYVDVYGKKCTIEKLGDPLVQRAYDSHAFVEVEHPFEQTRMLTPEFTKASTWVVPLLTGNELVGVLKFEDMLMAAVEIRRQLEPFFSYAALVLKNAISGYATLKKAYDELRATNETLSSEVSQRQQAEESLRNNNALLQLKLESVLVPDIEITDQELSNFLDVPSIQSLMEDFTRLTGMATAIVDLKGTVLVASGWQDICTKFHRMHPDTARHCTESDLYLSQNLKVGEYVAYKCKNGLWDVVTPFFVGGKHLGNIFTGQFFYEDEPMDIPTFESQAARYGFDNEKYMAALLRVPRFSRGTINTLMDFLIKFSDVFSKLNYSNLKLAKAMLENKHIEDQLRNVNEALGERLAELEHKKAEVERMNKLFVGRELRMIELKDKIKELEREKGA